MMNLKGKFEMKYFAQLICFVLLMVSLPSMARFTGGANGEWQYLIRRGDTNGVGASIIKKSDPNCPFYVGYFSLDFQETTVGSKFQMKPDYKHLIRYANSSKGIIIGKDSYEKRGSYTPYDSNATCDNPMTTLQGELAPLKIVKVTANGKEIHWVTDFLYGSKAENARWEVQANYNGRDLITGRLKAYTCEGDGEERTCQLLNNTKFEAKRIESIEEASKKSLFKKQNGSPLQDLIDKVTGADKKYGVFERKQVYPSFDIQEALKADYVKPNIQAILPASAVLPAMAACNATIGLEVCRRKDGTVLGECLCKVCQNFGCAAGQQPSGGEVTVCTFCQSGGTRLCRCDGNPNRCAGPPISPSAAGCVK
jgi:hypothetical protein